MSNDNWAPAGERPHILGYDKQGQPVDLLTFMRGWSREEERAYKRVGDYEDGTVRVSTVWLGSDHRFPTDYPNGEPHQPLIFETMVFAVGEDFDQRYWRYSTEAEALTGHAAAVAFFSNKANLAAMRLGGLELPDFSDS